MVKILLHPLVRAFLTQESFQSTSHRVCCQNVSVRKTTKFPVEWYTHAILNLLNHRPGLFIRDVLLNNSWSKPWRWASKGVYDGMNEYLYKTYRAHPNTWITRLLHENVILARDEATTQICAIIWLSQFGEAICSCVYDHLIIIRC